MKLRRWVWVPLFAPSFKKVWIRPRSTLKNIYRSISELIWDEVPTMVEIAIFWFQIHITNGLNFMHRKWHTENQYMVKSAENRMRSNLELLPVINVKSRPRYISALEKSSPIYLGSINFDTILMHWMSVKLADNFQIREHSWPCLFQSCIVLQYTPKTTQK
jgi:hypothetical protein